MRRRRFLLLALAALVVLVACGEDEPGGAPRPSSEAQAADGFEVTEVYSELEGPTQMVLEESGTILVAQLNGEEGSSDGQILRLDADERRAEPEVLFDGLTTPTGVAVVDDEIWVMEERTLSRGPVDGGELDVVLDDLPYNGRSEGTLTTTPEGDLLYNTSGTLDGTRAAEGSGIVFSLTPGEEPVMVADGFKHAYAHVYDDDGNLWVTEISHGEYDGEPAPDEVVAVQPGDDFAWPRCIGDREPVAIYGGNEDDCAETPPSHALFDPGATPTSIEIAPWDPDVLVVALWVEGRVVTIPRTTDDTPAAVTTLVEGIDRPQDLLAVGDRLLVTDHEQGTILAINPT